MSWSRPSNLLFNNHRAGQKNWAMFSPSPSTSYIQYELNSTSRTIAKPRGGGLTTTNVTNPLQKSCLQGPTAEELHSGKYTERSAWHQTTPFPKLNLCARSNTTCHNEPDNAVFIAAIQSKNFNDWGLPIRYERFMVIWSADPPSISLPSVNIHFSWLMKRLLGGRMSRTWEDVSVEEGVEREAWGMFTYTVSIAWAWGRWLARVCFV